MQAKQQGTRPRQDPDANDGSLANTRLSQEQPVAREQDDREVQRFSRHTTELYVAIRSEVIKT